DLKRIGDGFKELDEYLKEMIEAARSTPLTEQNFLSTLVKAASEDEDAALSERELIGNLCILIMAGHDTTAVTLTYALVNLAMYPGKQQALYDDVKRVLGEDCSHPTFKQVNELTYCMSVMNETLRL
ncbi:hypothetical protein HDU76_012098, partial [Blyttiomyces sp. JEL0837]